MVDPQHLQVVSLGFHWILGWLHKERLGAHMCPQRGAREQRHLLKTTQPMGGRVGSPPKAPDACIAYL